MARGVPVSLAQSSGESLSQLRPADTFTGVGTDVTIPAERAAPSMTLLTCAATVRAYPSSHSNNSSSCICATSCTSH